MNRAGAAALLALLLAATATLLAAPAWACAGVAAAALGALRTRRERRGFLLFLAITLPVQALLFAVALPGPDPVRWGILSFGAPGALVGAAAAVRLAAILGANLAALSWWPAPVLLDALRLPPRATAFLGAVLLAAADLGRDAARLVDARRIDGRWPHGLWRKARAAGSLLPPLTILALRRAQTRAEALRLAGHAVGPRFAPLVAVTALAVAGRLAFGAALANVSLAYVVVFVGGLAFGPRVGALAGLLGMAVTNLLLTGAYLLPFANAPAMAAVGLLGGALRRVDFAGEGAAGRWAGRLLAAACGLAATAAFSVAADVATWATVPDYRGTPGSLRVLVLAGLAFNVPTAAANAVLFAAAVGPVSAAARSAGVQAPPGSTRSAGRADSLLSGPP